MSFKWCFMQVPAFPGRKRAGVLADAKWARKSIIKFGFLDGDVSLQDRVATKAQEWITRTGADLTLERRKDASKADIRVSFRHEGSWSLLGRYAQTRTDPAEPTMNFGWLTNASTDLDVQEVVLHEFGHALGLIHEHQQAGMKWDREAVIAELSKPPNSWSVEEIEHNVLDQYDPRELLHTPFDADSIMLYPFPPEWTLDGKGTKNNTDLSPCDIALIRDVYT